MDPAKVKDECLCKAARRNDVETMRILIATKQIQPCVADLSVNENKQRQCYYPDYYPGNKDFEDRTCVNTLSCLNRSLHYMCDDYNTNGDIEGVSLLLDAGAEVDVHDSSEHTPLMKAAGENFMDIMAAGAKINLDDKAQLSLQGATEAAQHVKKQLDALGIPSDQVIEWRSPLYLACKYYSGRKMLSQLLEAGANVLAVTKKRRLPLHVAFPDTRAVHLLACEPYNCPLDVKDLNGLTPLMINVTEEEWSDYSPPLSHENPCIMLLQHGASYEYKAPDQSFLYHMAQHQKLNPNICQVVFYSGNDLQVILQDIQEVQEMAEKQTDTSGYKWLVNFLRDPESLKMMSVRAIRSQLRKARPGLSIWGSIFRLPLPKPSLQLIALNHLQPDYGPWQFYGSVHPHVLEEYYRLHHKEFVWE